MLTFFGRSDDRTSNPRRSSPTQASDIGASSAAARRGPCDDAPLFGSGTPMATEMDLDLVSPVWVMFPGRRSVLFEKKRLREGVV